MPTAPTRLNVQLIGALPSTGPGKLGLTISGVGATGPKWIEPAASQRGSDAYYKKLKNKKKLSSFSYVKRETKSSSLKTFRVRLPEVLASRRFTETKGRRSVNRA